MERPPYAVTVTINMDSVISLYGARRGAMIMTNMLLKLHQAVLLTQPQLVLNETTYGYPTSALAYFAAITVVGEICKASQEEARSIPIPVKCVVLSTDSEEDVALARKVADASGYVGTQGKGPVIVATTAFATTVNDVELNTVPLEFYLKDGAMFRGFRVVTSDRDLVKSAFYPHGLTFYDGQHYVLTCCSKRPADVAGLITK